MQDLAYRQSSVNDMPRVEPLACEHATEKRSRARCRGSSPWHECEDTALGAALLQCSGHKPAPKGSCVAFQINPVQEQLSHGRVRLAQDDPKAPARVVAGVGCIRQLQGGRHEESVEVVGHEASELPQDLNPGCRGVDKTVKNHNGFPHTSVIIAQGDDIVTSVRVRCGCDDLDTVDALFVIKIDHALRRHSERVGGTPRQTLPGFKMATAYQVCPIYMIAWP